MTKENWVTVEKLSTKTVKDGDGRIDWKAEQKIDGHSNTASVHVSYRYSVSLYKKK